MADEVTRKKEKWWVKEKVKVIKTKVILIGNLGCK